MMDSLGVFWVFWWGRIPRAGAQAHACLGQPQVSSSDLGCRALPVALGPGRFGGQCGQVHKDISLMVIPHCSPQICLCSKVRAKMVRILTKGRSHVPPNGSYFAQKGILWNFLLVLSSLLHFAWVNTKSESVSKGCMYPWWGQVA